MSKTIRELAEELGVSKTAIRKRMNADFREKYTENLPGNPIAIDDEGCKLIEESFRKPPETFAETPETKQKPIPETPETKFLQEEITFLRSQLEEKDRRLAELTEALVNEQKLHAGTMKEHGLLPEGNSGQDAPKLSFKEKLSMIGRVIRGK